MDVTCSNCRFTLTIPDDKIPQGRKASFLCPKCKARVHVQAPAEDNSPEDFSDYDAARKDFEYIDESTDTALVCVQDPDRERHLEKILQHHGYYVITAGDPATALMRMKYHLFDIVVAQEPGDSGNQGVEKLLTFLKRLDIASRRKVIVFLVTGRYRTMDRMNALHESVNAIINHKDFADAEKIINRGIQEHQQFYSAYNEALRKNGKG